MSVAYHHARTLPNGNHTLGGVALPVGTRWVDRRQTLMVGQEVRRTLLGSVHVYAQTNPQGQPITLDISLPSSWLYEAKYQALKALAAIPGAQYSFTWAPYGFNAANDCVALTPETYTVIFRHHEPPALDFTHVENAPNDYDLWVGQIKLLAV